MAILDRPLFQRRLTKDQLRAYGIPAFANGGVVQKFAPGGEVGPSLPDARAPIFPGLMIQKDAIEREGALGGTGGDTTIADQVLQANTESFVDSQDLNNLVLEERNIESRINQLEKLIQQKRSAGLDTSAEDAELSALKTKLGETSKQKIEKQNEIKTKQDNKKIITTEVDTKVDDTQTKDTDEVEGDIEKEQSEIERLKTLALERSALYKDMLGDPQEMVKQQGLLQLAQFGLNLAAARGGNLAEKIAKSAKDPLTAFAQLASDASKDARAIDLAAIKSAEDQLQTEIEIAGKTDELEKVLLYTKAKESNPGNPLGAATTTSIIPKSEITEIDVYKDEIGINKKLFNEGGGSNQVFQGEDGKLYRVKPSALEGKGKYLYFKYPKNPNKSDFIEIEGVEVLER
tara:strand:+ start:410 stop:1618 length:1209 start_codon:yes stop_codon:yes gene_type:complete